MRGRRWGYYALERGTADGAHHRPLSSPRAPPSSFRARPAGTDPSPSLKSLPVSQISLPDGVRIRFGERVYTLKGKIQRREIDRRLSRRCLEAGSRLVCRVRIRRHAGLCASYRSRDASGDTIRLKVYHSPGTGRDTTRVPVGRMGLSSGFRGRYATNDVGIIARSHSYALPRKV